MSSLVISKPFVGEKDFSVYTVKKANIPITLRIKDKTRIVSFRNVSDATTIASSFESHYIFTKLWPDMTSDNFHLSKGPFIVPGILDIFQEDFNELKEYCALWNVGLLVVENLNIHDSSILFGGYLLSFNLDEKNYIDHFESVIKNNQV